MIIIFNYIKKKLSYLKNINVAPKDNNPDITKPISKNLNDNITKVKNIFGDSDDLIFRDINFGSSKQFKATLIYIDGLVDVNTIMKSIIQPFTDYVDEIENQKQFIDIITKQVLRSTAVTEIDTLHLITSECLNGNTIIIFDNFTQGLSVDSKGWDKRAVTEPQSEGVVRGPREGYTENLRTNTSLIRRKIKSEDLRLENFLIGRKTKTNVAIMYLDDVVNRDVLTRLRDRLNKINVDSILESGNIEEYIEDNPFSPFATIAVSEKPDVTAANILEGRIAIIVDGTPFVLTVPSLFIETFQSAEDYYGRSLYTNLIRVVRYSAYLIAIFGPAFYLSLVNFHQGLIPTNLLITIINAREGTSFPVIIEIIIMLYAFEIMREAGIRLPRPMGQTISIVGALIMGEAAVSAGLVGAPVVIAVAITAVASFLIPNQSETIPILRMFVLILSGIAGLFGLIIGVLAISIHLASLSSFGIPYFNGFTKYNKDSIYRAPLRIMDERPDTIANNNNTRRGNEMASNSPRKTEQENRVGKLQ